MDIDPNPFVCSCAKGPTWPAVTTLATSSLQLFPGLTKCLGHQLRPSSPTRKMNAVSTVTTQADSCALVSMIGKTSSEYPLHHHHGCSAHCMSFSVRNLIRHGDDAYPVTAHSWPLFLYASNRCFVDDIEKGLFKSGLLIKVYSSFVLNLLSLTYGQVFKFIFTSPTSAIEVSINSSTNGAPPPKRSKKSAGATRSNVASDWNATGYPSFHCLCCFAGMFCACLDLRDS